VTGEGAGAVEPVAGPVTEPGRTADWFADDRGIERRLKVSWHAEHRLIVLSVWREDQCTATFRLPLAEAPRLIAGLADALAQAARSGAGRRGRHRR